MDFLKNPKSVKVQGNTLRYYRQGAGETILFVHGITTYSFIWSDIAPSFINEYDVILVDLLGCGDSDKPLNQDFSLKRQAHLLKEFCDELNIERLHLVCHDVGGGVGQIFAVNYSNLLIDLVLINSVAYNFWPVQPIVAMRTPIIRQIAMASLDWGMFELVVKRALYSKTLLTKDIMDLFFKPMRTSEGRKGFLHFAKCLDNSNLTEIEGQIKTLPVSTLIIRGNEDVYLNVAIAEKLNTDIPDSKLIIIEKAGHFIQIDKPKELSDSIFKFITS